jgi:hypothetical protein
MVVSLLFCGFATTILCHAWLALLAALPCDSLQARECFYFVGTLVQSCLRIDLCPNNCAAADQLQRGQG